jgi:hypothetical protein
MDKREATAVLREHLERYRRRQYGELVVLIGKPQVFECRGASGATYQIEVGVHWDHQPGGALRVLASIDDGGWRALKPLTDDFIVAPDGTFVGE